MDSRLGYKIMEERNGLLYPLYHSRRPLAREIWHQAVQKEVIDGSGGTKYISGFHFFWSLLAVRSYLPRFRKPRELVVVKCLARGFRQKPRSLAWLANSIMLLETIMYVDVPYCRRYQERWVRTDR